MLDTGQCAMRHRPSLPLTCIIIVATGSIAVARSARAHPSVRHPGAGTSVDARVGRADVLSDLYTHHKEKSESGKHVRAGGGPTHRWGRSLRGMAERDHIVQQRGATIAERARAVVEVRKQHVRAADVARRGLTGGAVLVRFVAAHVVQRGRALVKVGARAAAAAAATAARVAPAPAAVAGAVDAEALAVRHRVALRVHARRARAAGVARAVEPKALAVGHRVPLGVHAVVAQAGSVLEAAWRGACHRVQHEEERHRRLAGWHTPAHGACSPLRSEEPRHHAWPQLAGHRSNICKYFIYCRTVCLFGSQTWVRG